MRRTERKSGGERKVGGAGYEGEDTGGRWMGRRREREGEGSGKMVE